MPRIQLPIRVAAVVAALSPLIACAIDDPSTEVSARPACDLDCPDPPPPRDPPPPPPPPDSSSLVPISLAVQPSLEYIGFFGLQYDDVFGHPATYSVDRTARYTNLSFVNHDINLIKAYRDHDLQAIVEVFDIFFGRDASGIAHLKSDADIHAQWDPLVAAIHENALDSTIAAFYPIDEPYLDAANCDGPLCQYTTPALTMKQWLERVNWIIKSSLPSTKSAVIFSAGEIMGDARFNTGQYFIPSGYDWVGYDNYDATAPHDQFIARLESAMTVDQRVMLIPPTSANIYALDAPTSAGVSSQLSWAQRRAYSDPKVIGIFGFTFQPLQVRASSGADPGYWSGLEALPNTLSSFTSTGQSVSAPRVYSIDRSNPSYTILNGANFTAHCSVQIFNGGNWKPTDTPLRSLDRNSPELWCMTDKRMAIQNSAFAGMPSANLRVNSRGLSFGELRVF